MPNRPFRYSHSPPTVDPGSAFRVDPVQTPVSFDVDPTTAVFGVNDRLFFTSKNTAVSTSEGDSTSDVAILDRVTTNLFAVVSTSNFTEALSAVPVVLVPEPVKVIAVACAADGHAVATPRTTRSRCFFIDRRPAAPLFANMLPATRAPDSA